MKDQFIRLAAISHISTILRTLEEMQLDVQALREKAQLPDSVEDNQDAHYIPVARGEEFMHLVYQQLTPEQQIDFCHRTGLINAKKLIEHTSFEHCVDLEDALKATSITLYTLSPSTEYGLEHWLSRPWYFRKRPFSNAPECILSEMYLVTALTYLIRLLSGSSQWQPGGIRLMSPNTEPFSTLFAGQVQYYSGQESTAVALDQRLLREPVDPRVASQVTRPGLQPEKTMTSTLRLSIPLYLSEGRPSIEKIADLVGMSSRTLKRRLKDEGTSYSQLLDECILELGSTMLKETDLSIADISAGLGYPYTNHFCRAFKRLSGLTPGQYRSRYRK